jgi:NAD(P)-dependent dehydrogenase (short-subunit alcohol dehydrogenase family)
MLLHNKIAVIYGAGGAVGGAVARAFARDGAVVFLTGRHLVPVQALAEEIRAGGGTAHAAEVDALDAAAVDDHTAAVLARSGRIDISFNLISNDHLQGTPLVDLAVDDLVAPISARLTTQFLTARAAARQMIKQRGGVVLLLTAQVGRTAWPLVGGFGVACAALEGFARSLAAEVGPYDVRVVCLRSSGSPDAPNVDAAWERHAERADSDQREWHAYMTERTLLRRLPRLSEVADVAVLMASDRASAVTGAVTNVTCGEVVD